MKLQNNYFFSFLYEQTIRDFKFGARVAQFNMEDYYDRKFKRNPVLTFITYNYHNVNEDFFIGIKNWTLDQKWGKLQELYMKFIDNSPFYSDYRVSCLRYWDFFQDTMDTFIENGGI